LPEPTAESRSSSRNSLFLKASGSITSKKSAEALLAAIAAANYDDPDESLDQQLADLAWVSGLPKSATFEAFMAGGYLAAVENDDAHTDREFRSFEEVISPFLARNASLVQISNVQAVRGMPGLDGYGATPDDLLPISAKVDHSSLLRNQEFAGIVVRKHWVHDDILSDLPAYIEATRELGRLIDQELEETT
jgi:hypothetical protein